MREIKFRAWDKQNKCWFEQTHDWLNMAFPSCELITGCIDSDEGVECDDNFELTQFTGCRGKNMVEIWEGDIFKAIDDDGKNDTWQVSFIDGCFVGYRANNYQLKLDYWIPGQIEIIGNIYSNPELLSEAR